MTKNIAIVLSGGKGSRIDSKMPKQYIEIGKKPIICHTIEKFEDCEIIDEIVIVVSKDYLNYFKENIYKKYNFKKVKKIIIGGKERAFSVKNALDALSFEEYEKNSIVLVHDGARPFISSDIIKSGVAAAKESEAAVIAVKAKDTVKIADKSGFCSCTPDRESVWLAQTPQIFKLDLIKSAYSNLADFKNIPTDDSSLIELLGHSAKLVLGSYKNFKITTEEDLELAKFLLKN